VFTYNYLGLYFTFLKVYIMFRVCSHLKEIHFFILQQRSPHRHPRRRKVGGIEQFRPRKILFRKNLVISILFHTFAAWKRGF